MTSAARGSLLVVLAAVTWGFMPILARVAFAGGASVSTVLFVRFGVAGTLFLAYLLATGGLRALERRDAAELAFLGAANAAIAGLYFTSLRHLPAALAALALYTYPAFAHALAYLLRRERPGPRGIASLLLASAGLALTFLPLPGAAGVPGTGPGAPGAGGTRALGLGLGLAAAVLWALILLRAGRLARRVPPVQATGVAAAGTAAVFLLAGALSGGLDFRLPPPAWTAMGAMGVFSTVLGGLAYFAGLGRVSVTRAAVLTTVEPVVTALAAAAFLGEPLTLRQAAGGGLVVLGAALAAGGGGAAEGKGLRDQPGSV